MNKLKSILAGSLAAITLLGCAPTAPAVEETQAVTEAPAVTETQAAAEETSAVASGSEVIEAVDVVQEGMVPVTAEFINDGEYAVTVDSSSAMFNITSCELTVENGEMTAVMHMGGKGYLYVYMGTGEEAAAADESAYIPFTEEADGTHCFTVPVAALDAGIPCAAFSKNKEKWYERTLLFRLDSLPREALKDGLYPTVESLGLEDGSYTVEVTLEGGSGRASVDSPAALRIENGEAFATIGWSSPNYDYMRIEDGLFLPINTEGNSVFEIPVAGFDWNLTVFADTVAMSTPHEIEYTLRFDSATLENAE